MVVENRFLHGIADEATFISASETLFAEIMNRTPSPLLLRLGTILRNVTYGTKSTAGTKGGPLTETQVPNRLYT